MSPVPVSLTLRVSSLRTGSAPKLSVTTGSTLKLLIPPPPPDRRVRDDRQLVALDLVVHVEPALGAHPREAEPRHPFYHRRLTDEVVIMLHRISRCLQL